MISPVGLSQSDFDSGEIRGDVYRRPLAPNAQSKIREQDNGFIKIFCRKTSRILSGPVFVSPHASELIHPLTLAVQKRPTVEELASTFTIFPSLLGSVADS